MFPSPFLLPLDGLKCLALPATDQRLRQQAT
jgi:hypothetical protein